MRNKYVLSCALKLQKSDFCQFSKSRSTHVRTPIPTPTPTPSNSKSGSNDNFPDIGFPHKKKDNSIMY